MEVRDRLFSSRASLQSLEFWEDGGRSGNYYLVNRVSRGGIRLNPVADYQCTEAAISDRIPLHGAAAFRCIQQFGVSPARRLHINDVPRSHKDKENSCQLLITRSTATLEPVRRRCRRYGPEWRKARPVARRGNATVLRRSRNLPIVDHRVHAEED